MKNLVLFIFSVLITSCIPLSIAPSIEDYKLVKGKRFKRKLPRYKTFIFEDPKKAGEFYQFADAKFNLQDEVIERMISFTLDDKEFYFSFYEVQKKTRTINLLPMVIDSKLDSKGIDPILEDDYLSRSGYWYLAISIIDTEEKDCLDENHKDYNKILSYLKDFKEEYLTTHNYLETVLKQK
jgi:hypothetical protein